MLKVLNTGLYLANSPEEVEAACEHFMAVNELPQWQMDTLEKKAREFPSLLRFSCVGRHEELELNIVPLAWYRADLERRLKEIEGL